jgi:hypothetical protein
LETEKVLNFTEDADPRSVSTFEVDEHLQEPITGLFAGRSQLRAVILALKLS